MKIIILEDEPRAAHHLERLLAKIAPGMQVVVTLDSVREGVEWLKCHPEPGIIFSDIQLADGLSFEIYNKVTVRCPIIFTTAYDNYAIKAFETNGIDYLLKPIEEERLRQAMDKARLFSPGIILEKLSSLHFPSAGKDFKSRFMVKVGDKIKSIPVAEIVAFLSREKASYIHTRDKHDYCIDLPLDQLEPLLDPGKFFRINRKYIVSIDACTNILAWSNSRLRLKIDGIDDPGIVVARERIAEFKSWLDR